MRLVALAALLLIGGGLFYYWLQTDRPWQEETIVLGQSCALSGPSAQLGRGMMVGANAYFAHTNDQGGVHDRRIELYTLDDSYEPKLTEANTRYLIEEVGVFGLFGYVGTPTTQAILDQVDTHQLPFIAPLTGAQLLRTPPSDRIVNIRSGYQEEAEQIVAFIQQKGLSRVAVFYQNDIYGRSGLAAARSALGRHGMQPVAEGSYNRNTLAVGHALYEIAPTHPEAVIMVDAYRPGATFIRRMREIGHDQTRFFHLSFVNSDSLMQELSIQESKGVYVSQVVPPPWDSQRPIIEHYQQVMARYYPDEPLSFASLEGFIAAKVTVKALKKSGKRLTRRGFLRAIAEIESPALEQIGFSARTDQTTGIKRLWITARENDRMVVVHEGI